MKLLSALLIAAAVAGCVPESAPAEPGAITEDPTVSIEGVSFEPNGVTVEPGATVTWEWNDGSIQHDVVFDDFASDVRSSGTFTHTFDETGTFEYVCSLHPNMTGTVFVVDGENR